ncbi:MAG: enoyl-CoA hydratase/isomerase family protein [Bacteroidota bacterium]
MDTLNVEIKNGYALVQIDNGKVNAINTHLARDLRDIFLEYAENDEVGGVALIGKPHCFSAGLDIMMMATSGMDDIVEYWRIYMEALQAMVRFPKPFICGITGFAPAAATCVALCADYRIMGQGDKHVIGLNEFKMSLVIPEMMGDIYAYHLGEKAAWEAVQSAQVFTAEEACAVGLVNESVAVEEVVAKTEERTKKMLNILPSTYATSKNIMRKGLLKVVNRDISAMLQNVRSHLEDPATKQMFELFLAKLKSR